MQKQTITYHRLGDHGAHLCRVASTAAHNIGFGLALEAVRDEKRGLPLEFGEVERRKLRDRVRTRRALRALGYPLTLATIGSMRRHLRSKIDDNGRWI